MKTLYLKFIALTFSFSALLIAETGVDPAATTAPIEKEPLSEAVSKFDVAVGMALSMDQTLLDQAQKIDQLHQSVEAKSKSADQLRRQLQEVQNNPPTPEEELPLPPPQAGAGGGGSPGGGSGGGGGGSDLQAPQMASLPSASSFQLPQSVADVNPDFSNMDFGSDREASEFKPSSSSLPGFTPPKMDAAKKPDTQPQFSPANIAGSGMPKLKTLESVPTGGGGAGGGASQANAGGAAGGGAPMTGGGGGGGGGAFGGDGGPFGSVGAEAGYDSASGIVARDPGFGSSSSGGESSSSEGGGYGDSEPSKSSKALNSQVSARPAKAGGRYQRSKGDGSLDNTIFGKLSFWIEDSCGFLPDSKNSDRPSICGKAVQNELKLTYLGNDSAPIEKAVETPSPQSKPMKKSTLPPGVREIASVPEQPAYNTPESVPTVTKTVAPKKNPSEDLLGALRAGN